MRLPASEAANAFIDAHFPRCYGALLAGSVAEGRETDQSDLDLVIVERSNELLFREAFVEQGWNIEVFILTPRTYRKLFQVNSATGVGALQRMCAHGIVIKDDGVVMRKIQQEAREAIRLGPKPWSLDEMNDARFEITEYVADLIGSAKPGESMMVAAKLADLVHCFVLRVNERWIGEGKWIIRALSEYDASFCNRFVDVFQACYTTGDKDGVVQFVNEVLAPYGGQLFAGHRK